MQASNTQLAKQDKNSEPGLIRLITSSKLWPVQQDNRVRASDSELSYGERDGGNRIGPNLDPAEAVTRSDEQPAEPNHDLRLRFIEEHYKNGVLEQKLETMKAMLGDIKHQRDSWQTQAERSLLSFQETQQELLRFVRQTHTQQKKPRKRGLFSLFRKTTEPY